jgi:hypothetical protein
MFLGLGHQVAGHFDVGSTQRPKIPGVTDISYEMEDAYSGADFLVLHQVERFPQVFEQCAQRMGKRPVILHAFGQGCLEQHRYVKDIANSHKNAFVVAYSVTDYHRYLQLGMSPDKIRMIRFGKEISQYQGKTGWQGKLPICYMACNSIAQRGEGCGWSITQRLINGTDLPLIVGGKDTNVVGGIDALTHEGMINLYHQARCYFSIGTIPAPLVLTQVEAMCAGCPVVAYDNLCGIANEGFPITVSRDVKVIEAIIKAIVGSRDFAEHLSQSVLSYARDTFSMDIVASHWQEFMGEMV